MDVLELATAIQRRSGGPLVAATGLAAAYTWYEQGDLDAFHQLVDELYRRELPVRPEDLGLTLPAFTELTGDPVTATGFVDHVHARTSSGPITPEGRIIDE